VAIESDRSPLRFDLPGGRHLRPFEESDADQLWRLVAANRAYLAEWLPWAAGESTVERHLEFIRQARRQAADDNGFQTAIVDGEAIVGVIGFHRVDWTNRATSIGYWIAEASRGRGTVTEAVRALTTHAFEVWKLNRVEIRAATGNARSAAIPTRLGFTLEGVLRQVERHADHFKDVAVYSVLAPEWPAAASEAGGP
jgi:ribosomal-protein-serine acetyltransferase